MFKKIKTWLLIALCLLLFGCSRSCDLLWLYLYDHDAFVYVMGQDVIWGVNQFTGSSFTIPSTFTRLYSVYAACANMNSLGYCGIGSSNSKAPFLVIDQGANQVDVIDSNTDTRLKTISVGNGPTFGAFSRDYRWFFVSNTLDGTITRINVSNYTVSNTIQLPSGSHPTNILTSWDDSRMFFLDPPRGTVNSFSFSTVQPVMTTSVGLMPMSMAMAPDGSSVYVGGSDNTVTFVDTITMLKYKTLTGIDTPTCISPARDGSALRITNGTLNTLTVVKTLNYKVKTYPVGINPSGVASDAYGTNLYISNKGSNNITVLNGSDYSLERTIPLPGPPISVVSLF